MIIASPPDIFNLGHRSVAELLFDTVQIEEKVDGSQFAFCKSETGEFFARSRKKQIDPDAAGMFQAGVDAVRDLPLQPSWVYRGEYLSKPKHNALAYQRIPKKHVIIYDIMVGGERYLNAIDRAIECERLGLEVVPILYFGPIAGPTGNEELREMLEAKSILGDQKIEGLVIKNYARLGYDKKVLMAKLVSDDFKETHRTDWKRENPGGKDIIETIAGIYTTTARWQKAVQHLGEMDLLTNEPKDIGKLIHEVQEDVKKECRSEIEGILFAWAWKQISRKVIAGLPQWYKEQLAHG